MGPGQRGNRGDSQAKIIELFPQFQSADRPNWPTRFLPGAEHVEPRSVYRLEAVVDDSNVQPRLILRNGNTGAIAREIEPEELSSLTDELNTWLGVLVDRAA